jgi:hypothetical protein
MGKTLTKVHVPEKAHIRVDWEDYPENRTVESKNRRSMVYLQHQ